MAAKPKASKRSAASGAKPSNATSTGSVRAAAKKSAGAAAKSSDPEPRDFSHALGSGGETHQTVVDGGPLLTTQQGIPVADDQNTLKVDERGPALLDDFHFREKIFHFDHERIPERVVHARGFGVHGYFEPYDAAAELSRADLFQRARAGGPSRRSHRSRPRPDR